MINESLKGGSIEKILDLNNKVNISRSFENNNENNNNINNNKENNNNTNSINLFETFGPINNNNTNKIDNNNIKTNKAQFESFNSNFTFGNNSQLKNSNNSNNNTSNFGVDNIIKNINLNALNYFSKYEKNEDNVDNKNEINLEQSMQSESKLISPSNKINLFSTWKKNDSIKANDSIKEEIDNENENKNEKELILNKNKDLFVTFGEVPKESIKLENDSNQNTLKKNFEEDYLDTEGICNFYKETKKIINEDISTKVNEALKDAKESSE